MKAVFDISDRRQPLFTIIAANICSCKGRIPIKGFHLGKIDAAFQKRHLALRLVPLTDLFAISLAFNSWHYDASIGILADLRLA